MVSNPSFCDEIASVKGTEAQEIGDSIFLGSVKAATDGKALERWKIARILVVDLTSSMLWPGRFCYKRVKLDDVPTANLLEVLPDALAFLGEAQLRREPVLVHCTRGVSRSASVVIAFLMVFKGLSYEDAKSRVERKRPAIFPNLGFRVQLQHLERLAAGGPAGHWGAKMKWLRDSVPRGGLTAIGAAFEVRDAMSQPVRSQLDQVRALCEEALTDRTLLEQRAPWKPHGLFFTYLHKYKAIPLDRALVSAAAAVAQRLKGIPETSPDSLPGVQAAVDLAGEIEAWIRIAAPALEAEPQHGAKPGAATDPRSAPLPVEGAGGKGDDCDDAPARKQRRTQL